MTSYVTHLESAIDGTQYAPGHMYTTHKGRPLWVRYYLETVGQALKKEMLSVKTIQEYHNST